MTTPEAFNDQELTSLFDAETQREIDDAELTRQHDVVQVRLWAAIDTLEINTCCGSDPENYGEEYDALVDVLREVTLVDSSEGSDELLEQKIHIAAQAIWDQDVEVITRIAIAIDQQLFPEPTTDTIDTKKKLIATLIAHDIDVIRWLPLIEHVLDGESLDTDKAEDMDIMMQAMQESVQADSAPQALLYDALLELFEAPEIDMSLNDIQELQRLNMLTLFARDVTETTYYMPGEAMQPNRHEKLHELIREYDIADQDTIETIIRLTDAFSRAE
jgi:hypothetical protein